LDEPIQQIFTIIVAVLISVLVTYLITFLLIKINKKLTFLLPGILFIGSAIFWILGLIDDTWGALGYLIYASFSLIAAVGALISSLIIWKKRKL
jgi:hypothetical protein